MKKSLSIIIILLCFLVVDVSATHIVAGFSSYKHVSDNAYEINFTLLRDQLTNGANLDNSIVVQIYTFNGVSSEFLGNTTVDLGEVETITDSNLLTTFNVSLEKGEYSFLFELSDPDVDYQFVFQRCCRSPEFLNILNSNETGISLMTTITKEAQAVQNSSIEFEELPPFIVQPNEQPQYAINAISIDGDELSYQFAPIFSGGGTDGTNGPGSGDPFSCTGVTPHGPCALPFEQVTFMSDDFSNPFQLWENQGMDPVTGTLQGTPGLVGQFSYGFAIHETRNGQIINTTSFDYLVFVTIILSTKDNLENNIWLKGNPTEGSFIVENNLDQILNYEVFNLRGEKIEANIEQASKQVKINIDGPAGMYILRASNDTSNQTLRLIKL